MKGIRNSLLGAIAAGLVALSLPAPASADHLHFYVNPYDTYPAYPTYGGYDYDPYARWPDRYWSADPRSQWSTPYGRYGYYRGYSRARDLVRDILNFVF